MDTRPESVASEQSARLSPERPPDGIPPPASAEAGTGGAFSREELRRISEDVAKSFPQALEGTWVVLVDVDPRRLHAYWNVDPQDLEAARRRLGLTGEQPPLVIWFHDAARPDFGGIDASIEVQAQELRGRCYVDARGDATTYVADLGLRDADGNLALLARSNPVDVPRAGQRTDESRPSGCEPSEPSLDKAGDQEARGEGMGGEAVACSANAPESSHPGGGQPAAATARIATPSSFSLGSGKRSRGDADR